MYRPYHFVVSLSAALLVTVLSAGCKDDTQATPRITFDSDIKAGKHAVKDCGKSGPWFNIGSFGNPALGRVDPANPDSPLKDPVKPVDDGGDDQQGRVSLNCAVVERGEGFDVTASAQLTGATGGSVTIIGFFKPTGDQKDIQVRLTKLGETFSDLHCVATFDPALGQAVAAGRIWADVVCPNAEQPNAQQTCETHAQFRFENCSQ